MKLEQIQSLIEFAINGERRAGDPAVLTASNKKAREILD